MQNETVKQVRVDALGEFEDLQKEMAVLDSMVSGLQAYTEGGLNKDVAYSYRHQFNRVEGALKEFKAKVPIYKGEYNE